MGIHVCFHSVTDDGGGFLPDINYPVILLLCCKQTASEAALHFSDFIQSFLNNPLFFRWNLQICNRDRVARFGRIFKSQIFDLISCSGGSVIITIFVNFCNQVLHIPFHQRPIDKLYFWGKGQVKDGASDGGFNHPFFRLLHPFTIFVIPGIYEQFNFSGNFHLIQVISCYHLIPG